MSMMASLSLGRSVLIIDMGSCDVPITDVCKPFKEISSLFRDSILRDLYNFTPPSIRRFVHGGAFIVPREAVCEVQLNREDIVVLLELVSQKLVEVHINRLLFNVPADMGPNKPLQLAAP